ncbi:MAG: type I-B CRISPR-associated protein Cas5 [Actinobacteria bacterium]|nr:type I-B CRISPR-associated protein Cas5 [Actinomycetota bacterium]
MNDILVFSLFGDLGHFRKFYTTSSPLTFSFPPPPTIQGILGAICGIEKEKYLKVFSRKRCRVALRIINPVVKTRIGINLINTKGDFWVPVQKGSHKPRTQIRTEFVKNPCFRIYVVHEDSCIFNLLTDNIKNHKTVYTISLGLSELLADIDYVGVFRWKINGGTVNINSVLPLDGEAGIVKIQFEKGKRYFKERVPIVMTENRIVEEYADVVFEQHGESIKCSIDEYVEIDNGECITFF